MYPPRKRKDVRRFIGMINYYRDISSRKSHTPQELIKLTLVCVKFKMTSVEQEAFEETKQIVAK